MDVSGFLTLLTKELSANSRLNEYYRLVPGNSRFLFRKAYLEQRLEYINDNLPSEGCNIWDAGCGYGTTSIFLALNGHHVTGTTLEYYYSEIEKRKKFWSRYGELDNLTVKYEDIFDTSGAKGSFDIVLLQDTLHHLEPVKEAISIIRDSIKPGGKIIAIEENGSSAFIAVKNLLKRGFVKKKEYYDEGLGRKVLMADENARSLNEWNVILKSCGFDQGISESGYIRLFPPCFFRKENYGRLIDCEQRIGKSGYFPSRYFFFGINFIADK